MTKEEIADSGRKITLITEEYGRQTARNILSCFLTEEAVDRAIPDPPPVRLEALCEHLAKIPRADLKAFLRHLLPREVVDAVIPPPSPIQLGVLNDHLAGVKFSAFLERINREVGGS